MTSLCYCFQKTVHVSGTARSGRYYVIVHFYQPNFLTFVGKVVISGQNAASTLMTFRHCPHVSGCRTVGMSQYREGMSESIYIGRQNNILVSITIPEDKGVWIVSTLEISYCFQSDCQYNPTVLHGLHYGFELLRCVIGRQNLANNQSWLARTRFPALVADWHTLDSSSRWFFGFLASFVIGQSCYFGYTAISINVVGWKRRKAKTAR